MEAAAADTLEERFRALDERVRSLRAAFQADDERKIRVNTDINTLKVWMNRTKPQIGSLETLDLQGLEDRLRSSMGDLIQTQADRLCGETTEYTRVLMDRLREENGSTLEAALSARGTQFATHSDQEVFRREFEGAKQEWRTGLEVAAQSTHLVERLRVNQEALRGEFDGAREEWRAGFESLEVQLAQAVSQDKLEGIDLELQQLRSSLADEVHARKKDGANFLTTLTETTPAVKEDFSKNSRGREPSANIITEDHATAVDVMLWQVETTMSDDAVHRPPVPQPEVHIEESFEALKVSIAELKAELKAVRPDQLSVNKLLSPQAVSEWLPADLTLEDADGRAWTFDAVGDFLAYTARRLKEFQQSVNGEAAARIEFERQLLLDGSQRQAARELQEEQRRQAHQQSQAVVVKRVEEMNASIAASLTSKSDKEDFIYINGEVLELKNSVKQLEQRIHTVQAEALRRGPPCSTLQSEDGGTCAESGEMRLIEDLQAQSVRLQTLARECHFASACAQTDTKQAAPSTSLVELYAPAAKRDASVEPQRPPVLASVGASFGVLPAAEAVGSPQPLFRPMREASPIAVREAKGSVPTLSLAIRPHQRELWQLPSRLGIAVPSRDPSPVARRQQLSPPQLARGLFSTAPVASCSSTARALAGSGSFPAAAAAEGPCQATACQVASLVAQGQSRQWHRWPEGSSGERLTR